MLRNLPFKKRDRGTVWNQRLYRWKALDIIFLKMFKFPFFDEYSKSYDLILIKELRHIRPSSPFTRFLLSLGPRNMIIVRSVARFENCARKVYKCNTYNKAHLDYFHKPSSVWPDGKLLYNQYPVTVATRVHLFVLLFGRLLFLHLGNLMIYKKTNFFPVGTRAGSIHPSSIWIVEPPISELFDIW